MVVLSSYVCVGSRDWTRISLCKQVHLASPVLFLLLLMAGLMCGCTYQTILFRDLGLEGTEEVQVIGGSWQDRSS